MTRAELFYKIESLRAKMYYIADSNTEYDVLLAVSQELDKLIIMYHTAV
jgi:hypothetical protein